MLNGDLKQRFDSLIAVVDFDKLDSVYESGDIDGNEYRLYIGDETIIKQFYVHSMKPPKELESFKNLFIKMKGGLPFVPVDTLINFQVNPPESPTLRSVMLPSLRSQKKVAKKKI